jgi:hypothetical protein
LFEAQGVPRIEIYSGDALSPKLSEAKDEGTTAVPSADHTTTFPEAITTATTATVGTAPTTPTEVLLNPDADVERPSEPDPGPPAEQLPADTLPPVDPSRLTVPRGVVPTPTAVPSAPRITTGTGEIRIDFLPPRRR